MYCVSRFASAVILSAVTGMAIMPLRAEDAEHAADLETLAAPLHIDPKSLSVSGMSSGAFMAHQFHIAYSEWIMGAGIIAGGPSGCAQHQPHSALPAPFPPPWGPLLWGPLPWSIENSIAWGVNYCTTFTQKYLQPSDAYSPASYGISWWTQLVTNSYELASDRPFSREGQCPTSRYSLRVRLDELTEETNRFDPLRSDMPRCPQPTCTLLAGEDVKYRNNPHAFACLLANATLYDRKHAYLSDNITKSKVFITRGLYDEKLPVKVSDALYWYYRILGVPAGNIDYQRNDPPIRHTMFTDNFNKVSTSGTCELRVPKKITVCNEPLPLDCDPYIDDCSCTSEENCPFGSSSKADAAGHVLHQIYYDPYQQGSWRETREPLTTPEDTISDLESKVTAFNQRPSLPDNGELDWSSLSDTGYIYIPDQCNEGRRCRLHVAFHGCMQGDVQWTPFVKPRPTATKNFAVYAGYNEWAKANDVIVLYPQVRTSLPAGFDLNCIANPLCLIDFSSYFGPPPVNGYGCWDLWGYSNPLSPDYNYRSGKQMKAVAWMINKLLKQDLLPIGEQP